MQGELSWVRVVRVLLSFPQVVSPVLGYEPMRLLTSQLISAHIFPSLAAQVCGCRLVFQVCLPLFPSLAFCLLFCLCAFACTGCHPLVSSLAPVLQASWVVLLGDVAKACGYQRVCQGTWKVSLPKSDFGFRSHLVRASFGIGWQEKFGLRGAAGAAAAVAAAAVAVAAVAVAAAGAAGAGAGCCEVFVPCSFVVAAAGCLCNRKNMQVVPANAFCYLGSVLCAGFVVFLNAARLVGGIAG